MNGQTWFVLDINFRPTWGVPGCNGRLQHHAVMHRFQEAAEIPVIIITGGDAAKFKERALAAGAVLSSKTHQQRGILMAVRRILGQGKAQPRPGSASVVNLRFTIYARPAGEMRF